MTTHLMSSALILVLTWVAVAADVARSGAFNALG